LRYRPCKVKYEHIVFAMMILKKSLKEEVKVNISELVSFKTLVVQRMHDMNERIVLDVGPKVRREFLYEYIDIIDVFYDFNNGLTYVIKNDRDIDRIISILENDLIGYPIYEVLCDEELYILSTKEEVIKTLKKRKRL